MQTKVLTIYTFNVSTKYVPLSRVPSGWNFCHSESVFHSIVKNKIESANTLKNSPEDIGQCQQTRAGKCCQSDCSGPGNASQQMVA